MRQCVPIIATQSACADPVLRASLTMRGIPAMVMA
jgi:hypothetical protein